MSCATAFANLRYILDNDIPSKADHTGEYLIDRLRELQSRCDLIAEVRGRGLLIAIALRANVAMDVVRAAAGQGLLLNACKPNVIRLMPPLTVSRDEVLEAVGRFEKALATACSGLKAGR